MINDVQIEGVLHNFTVQWNCQFAIDGFDIADGLRTSGNTIDKGQQDEEGVFRIEQIGRASIFDLDALGKDAAYGERYLQWIHIESGDLVGGIPLGFQIFVVFRHPTTGDYVPLQEITAGFVFGVSRVFYLSEVIHVPQGCALLIQNLPEPTAGEFNVVKFSVQAASSSLEDASLQRAMCCDDSSGDSDDEPATFLYRQTYSFSSQALQITSGDDDAMFFSWSGYWNGDDALAMTNYALAIVMQDEGVVPPSVDRWTFRTSTLTNLAIRTTAPFNGRPIAEINGVRSFIGAPQLFASGALNPVTLNFPVPAGSLLRVGILPTTNALADILADLEITTVE
jgi:hypothetical protein